VCDLVGDGVRQNDRTPNFRFAPTAQPIFAASA